MKEVEIDIKQLAALCRMKPTIADCAAFFKCSTDTIERRVKNETGLTFAVFREQNMVATRFILIRKAIQKAEGGDNIMMIFTLKNLCGWRDKAPDEDSQTITINNNMSSLSDEELDLRIKTLMAEEEKK